MFWTGTITSVLLLELGRGRRAVRLDRRPHRSQRALFATIAHLRGRHRGLRAGHQHLGSCSLCRMLASLGIGGEWGIGAALVAEGVPENRRVEAGVILQTASPLGRSAGGGGQLPDRGSVVRSASRSSPGVTCSSAGLLPAVVALGVRRSCARARCGRRAARRAAAEPRELFAPGLRAATLSGLFAAVMAIHHLVGAATPSSRCSAAARPEQARTRGLPRRPAAPAGRRPGRRTPPTPSTSAACSAPSRRCRSRACSGVARCSSPTSCCRPLALFATFGADAGAGARVSPMLFPVGAGVFGVFGAFTFYLPELFPARLRATGAGFCYNIGRVFAAARAVRGRDALGGAGRLERSAGAGAVLGWAGAAGGRGALAAPGHRRDARPHAAALGPRP